MKTWTLAEGVDLYRRMVSPFHDKGYLLAVYGSTLSDTGNARDLDLMAVPWRPTPVAAKCAFDDICLQFRLTPLLGPPYIDLMRTWSKAASDRDGRIIDFVFQRSAVTLDESLEFSMRHEMAKVQQ